MCIGCSLSSTRKAVEGKSHGEGRDGGQGGRDGGSLLMLMLSHLAKARYEGVARQSPQSAAGVQQALCGAFPVLPPMESIAPRTVSVNAH